MFPLRRPGRVTLITVLVILGAIAVAIGLILPGVCRVREAAGRAKCANNLKQIALAAHTYHDTHGYFPPGTVVNPGQRTEQRLSWLAALYPYLEAGPMAGKIDPAAAWDEGRNRDAAAEVMSVFTCPSLTGPAATTTNYVGMAGVGTGAATLSTTDPKAGVFGYDRTTKQADIRDGLAGTILVVESPRVAPWAQGGAGTVRGFDPADRPYVGPGREYGGHQAEKQWTARDPLGGNFAMADGSARFVKETVAPEVLEALATIHGGETLPPNW